MIKTRFDWPGIGTEPEKGEMGFPKGVAWLREKFFPDFAYMSSKQDGRQTDYLFERGDGLAGRAEAIHVFVDHGLTNCVHVTGSRDLQNTLSCINSVTAGNPVVQDRRSFSIERYPSQTLLEPIAEYIRKNYLPFLDMGLPIVGYDFNFTLQGSSLTVQIDIGRGRSGTLISISGPEAILNNLPRQIELQNRIAAALDNGAIRAGADEDQIKDVVFHRFGIGKPDLVEGSSLPEGVAWMQRSFFPDFKFGTSERTGVSTVTNYLFHSSDRTASISVCVDRSAQDSISIRAPLEIQRKIECTDAIARGRIVENSERTIAITTPLNVDTRLAAQFFRRTYFPGFNAEVMDEDVRETRAIYAFGIRGTSVEVRVSFSEHDGSVESLKFEGPTAFLADLDKPNTNPEGALRRFLEQKARDAAAPARQQQTVKVTVPVLIADRQRTPAHMRRIAEYFGSSCFQGFKQVAEGKMPQTLRPDSRDTRSPDHVFIFERAEPRAQVVVRVFKFVARIEVEGPENVLTQIQRDPANVGHAIEHELGSIIDKKQATIALSINLRERQSMPQHLRHVSRFIGRSLKDFEFVSEDAPTPDVCSCVLKNARNERVEIDVQASGAITLRGPEAILSHFKNSELLERQIEVDLNSFSDPERTVAVAVNCLAKHGETADMQKVAQFVHDRYFPSFRVLAAEEFDRTILVPTGETRSAYAAVFENEPRYRILVQIRLDNLTVHISGSDKYLETVNRARNELGNLINAHLEGSGQGTIRPSGLFERHVPSAGPKLVIHKVEFTGLPSDGSKRAHITLGSQATLGVVELLRKRFFPERYPGSSRKTGFNAIECNYLLEGRISVVVTFSEGSNQIIVEGPQQVLDLIRDWNKPATVESAPVARIDQGKVVRSAPEPQAQDPRAALRNTGEYKLPFYFNALERTWDSPKHSFNPIVNIPASISKPQDISPRLAAVVSVFFPGFKFSEDESGECKYSFEHSSGLRTEFVAFRFQRGTLEITGRGETFEKFKGVHHLAEDLLLHYSDSMQVCVSLGTKPSLSYVRSIAGEFFPGFELKKDGVLSDRPYLHNASTGQIINIAPDNQGQSIIFSGQKRSLLEFSFRKKEAEELFGQSRKPEIQRVPPVSAEKTFRPPKQQGPKEGKHRNKSHGGMRRR